jgi:hypothetical protein
MVLDEPPSATAEPSTTLTPRPPLPPAERDAQLGTARSQADRWAVALLAVCAAVALFAVYLRISDRFPLDSDGANNALQAWAMLHGNVLLHNWVLGDATYYASELPLYVIAESILGLHATLTHVVAAAVYVAVTAAAVAIAVRGSRGLAAWVRSAIVLAIVTSVLLSGAAGINLMVEKPDHVGTSAIMLAAVLLIDRAIGRRYLPPLLLVILVLGQISDATVLYVVVPSILLVCAYHMIAARRIRTADAAVAVTAAVSVPLAKLAWALLEHHGGYRMVPPRTAIAPLSQIPHNAKVTGDAIFVKLFGLVHVPGASLGAAGTFFRAACLVAALLGILKLLVTWRKASRADHLLFVVIVAYIVGYMCSTIAVSTNYREIVGVLPASAVLAARGLVPDRLSARNRLVQVGGVLGAAAVTAAALLPVTVAASLPAEAPVTSPVAAWLEAHGLKYGIAGYWDASVTTLLADGRVHVVAVAHSGKAFSARLWETNTSWYDPARHDATFAIADRTGSARAGNIAPGLFRRAFGRPAAAYAVAGKLIMIYHKNLLTSVGPGVLSLPTGEASSADYRWLAARAITG